jgi:FkbM family methyltransferase
MKLRRAAKRYLIQYPQWGFRFPRPTAYRSLQLVGSEYGGYYLDASQLDSNSVVYSLGVGDDISFDLALIQQFGVTVHAFDPTPQVNDWLTAQHLPDKFQFHRAGIADFDGETDFYLPPRSDFISHSIIHANQYSALSIRVPMIRLSSAMSKLGHSQVDVLKMDIEGAEFAVVEDLVRGHLRVRQICLEFHHRLSSLGTAKTKSAIALLEGFGMQLIHVCPRMEVFTFVSNNP